MTKLSQTQENLLKNVTSFKAKYDREDALLKAQYEASRELLKAPLRKAVLEAERAGTPQRQIHLAMGFQQAGPMLGFLAGKKQSWAETIQNIEEGRTVGSEGVDHTVPGAVDPLTLEVEDTGVLNDFGNNVYGVTLDGHDYGFVLYNVEGTKIVDFGSDGVDLPRAVKEIVWETWAEARIGLDELETKS